MNLRSRTTKATKMGMTVLTLTTAFALMLTGCSAPAVENNTKPQQSNNQQAAPDSGAEKGPGKGNFARADRMGEVSRVEGQVITLKVIEMSEHSNKSNNGNGNGSGGSGSLVPSQQQQLTYTGATESIVLPVDFHIEKTVRTDSGRKTEVVAVKELVVGDVLMLTYADKDKKTLSKIRLRPQHQGQPGQ